MVVPARGPSDVARQLLLYEAKGSQSQEGLERAFEQCCSKLNRHLSKVIGVLDTRLLFERSLMMTQGQYPFLRAVGIERDGCLVRLEEAVQQHGLDRVTEGLVALLANFLSLLYSFIGEDLVQHLISSLWPEVFPSTG